MSCIELIVGATIFGAGLFFGFVGAIFFGACLSKASEK